MLNKNINYLFILALATAFTAVAMMKVQVPQTPDMATALKVSGVVTDAETDEPIPNVEVQIEELAVSETTDDEGKFEITDIQEGGIYTVVVEHEGYERYEETHEIRDDSQNQQNQTDWEMGDDRMQQQNTGNKLEIKLQPSNR